MSNANIIIKLENNRASYNWYTYLLVAVDFSVVW